METVQFLESLLGLLFLVCYAYQFIYMLIACIPQRKKPPADETLHRYAILICARNEQDVIGDLLDSIRTQNYPDSLIKTFVMADNCTDATAARARARGAIVYERNDPARVGKGYALDALLRQIAREHPDRFDGYFVFDADNILRYDYIDRMNAVFSEGFDVVTSYRNSKNYGDSWISAGYALWFLRDSVFGNEARYRLKTSAVVAGTGFLFSNRLLKKQGGWPFHTLTEDTEFTVHHVLNGVTIGMARDAVFYDEQPSSFLQSWRQRMRWSKGYLQVYARYGAELVKGIRGGSFACFDLLMMITPAYALSVAGILLWCVELLLCILHGNALLAVWSAARGLMSMYGTLFFVGACTMLSEHRHIRAKPSRKLLSLFTFPLFMFTYIPISVAALFCRVEWKPIHHRVTAAQAGFDLLHQ